MKIPAAGGPPKKLLEVNLDEFTDFDCSGRADGSCVFTDWKLGEFVFHALDPIRGVGKELAKTRLGAATDFYIGISPDGGQVVLASPDQLPEKVRIIDLQTGLERDLQLPHGWLIWSLRWTAEGDALIAAAQSKSGYFIARIHLDGKTDVLLDKGRNHWLGHAFPSTDGRYLAFTQMTYENNVWLLANF